MRLTGLQLRYKVRENFTSYLFLLPFLVFFALLVLYPILIAIKISFYDYNYNVTSFTGLNNFIKLFKEKLFWKSLSVSFSFVLGVVPVSTVFSILTAVAIFEKSRFAQGYYRAVFYLPAVTSAVTVSLTWKLILQPNFGIANYVLGVLGISPVQWLGSKMALISLILMVITFNVGQPIILYIASLGAIPRTFYEAAEIDGASKLKMLIRITLPLLKPTTLYNVIMTSIASFQTFEVIILMTGGGPYYATNSLMFELYRTAFTFNNYGLASAIGILMCIVVVSFSIIQFMFLSSDVEY
jgi:multiple sugar transport system permease protein